MKLLLTICLMLSLILLETTMSQPSIGIILSEHPAADWKLVWADEFDVPGPPNPKNWVYETGLVRNHELQYYQPDNARCENGLLLIEGRRESKPNPKYKAGNSQWPANQTGSDYTAASIQTKGLHAWQYGRFEMRGRIDTRAGLWPAFWTLGVAGEWPRNGEIDIMEYYRGMVLANVAWGTAERYKANWSSVKKPVADFNDPAWATKFHVWRMDWDEKHIVLYLDDVALNTVDLTKTVNADADRKNPMHQPHYILLNLAIGGDNGGDPANTPFPSRFEVDYVRVYQRQQ